MDFNWLSFEHSHKTCNSQFNALRQEVDRTYQSKFDDDWLVGNWLQNFSNGKKSIENNADIPIENPLLPLKTNKYLEFIACAKKTLGSVERSVQKPTESQISAMDIIEQLDFGSKMNTECFDDTLIRNRVFFNDNYIEYSKESNYEVTISIVNMLMSLAADKGPCNFSYSGVISLDKCYESTQQTFESVLDDNAIQRVG